MLEVLEILNGEKLRQLTILLGKLAGVEIPDGQTQNKVYGPDQLPKENCRAIYTLSTAPNHYTPFRYAIKSKLLIGRAPGVWV